MTDLAERAERVRQIAEDVAHGRVLSRDDDSMLIEIPAEMGPKLTVLWGMGGFVPIYQPISIQGWYRYRVDLAPRAAGNPAPSVAEITAPTPPWRG